MSLLFSRPIFMLAKTRKAFFSEREKQVEESPWEVVYRWHSNLGGEIGMGGGGGSCNWNRIDSISVATGQPAPYLTCPLPLLVLFLAKSANARLSRPTSRPQIAFGRKIEKKPGQATCLVTYEEARGQLPGDGKLRGFPERKGIAWHSHFTGGLFLQ